MAKNKPAHILITRFSAMGDVAMTIPVILALQREYPNLKLSFLSRPFFAPLFSLLPGVEFISADLKGRHKGMFGLFRLYREIRPRNFEAVADLHSVLRTIFLSTLFKFDGLQIARQDKGRKEKSKLLTASDKEFAPLKTTHQRYADVFSRLGFPVDLLPSDTLGRLDMEAAVASLFDSGYRYHVGIAPFAAYSGKEYPEELMEEVLSAIDRRSDTQIFLFGGGAGEIKKLDAWAGRYSSVFNAAGKMGFGEELALISNLDLMLSMDSGNGHLAAVFGLPVITLWGITHPYAGFSPFGQAADYSLLADGQKYPLIPTSVFGNKCPPGYERVMESISPQMVVDRVYKILNGKL